MAARAHMVRVGDPVQMTAAQSRMTRLRPGDITGPARGGPGDPAQDHKLMTQMEITGAERMGPATTRHPRQAPVEDPAAATVRPARPRVRTIREMDRRQMVAGAALVHPVRLRNKTAADPASNEGRSACDHIFNLIDRRHEALASTLGEQK